jgi:hypothetical protein
MHALLEYPSFTKEVSKMYRKGFLPITLFITIFVLNNCASLKGYGGKAQDADNINCEAGIGCADIRTGKYYINVNGLRRRFIVTLPENYDSSKSYPLIFAWHGFGGSAIGVASASPRTRKGPYYDILRASENQAIFIAGQGLTTMRQV